MLLNKRQVDSLRDASLKLEIQDCFLAYDLMAIAKKQRPNGPLINKKLYEYKNRLKTYDDFLSCGKYIDFVNLFHDKEPVKWVLNNDPIKVKAKKMARFIRIDLSDTTCLNLDKVFILDDKGVNLAKGKKVLASSFYSESFSFNASELLQGEPTGGCSIHTLKEKNPWLVIDLGESFFIEDIVVFNRQDEHGVRSRTIKVSCSNDMISWAELFDNFKFVKFFLRQVNDIRIAIYSYFILGDYHNVFMLLSNMKEYGEKEEEASLLYNELNDLLLCENKAITPHGKKRTFKMYSEEEKKNTLSQVQLLLSLLNDKFGVAAFISSGTLLGIIRDGTFIDHDDDIDVCYISNYQQKEEVLKEREEICKYLKDNGFSMKPSDVAHYWGKTPSGVGFDLFTGYVHEGFCNMNPLKKNTLRIEDIFPLKHHEISGYSFYIPQHAHKVLVVNYGESWGTPDPLWSFDWSHARQDYGFLYFT